MTTATLALLIAAATLAATSIVAVVGVRARRAADRRLSRGLLELGEQMNDLARELVQTVEKVQEDGSRARLVESLGQSLDLDEVLARCADAAASLPGVAGALVSIELDGVPVAAQSGLGPASVFALSGPPDGSRVRAVGISYHYRVDPLESGATQSAIAVPIESEAAELGFLTVFGRGEEPPVAGKEFQTLEAIARHAAQAIESARQIDTVPRLPDTDGLTGLGNRQLFHRALALEAARSNRQGHRLSVCVLDLDAFRLTNQRLGQIEADRLLVRVAEMILDSIQPTDLACRIGGDEFGVILPESGRIDGEALVARLQATLSRLSAPIGPASMSAGVAELKPDDDGVSLFERAQRALDVHRNRGAFPALLGDTPRP